MQIMSSCDPRDQMQIANTNIARNRRLFWKGALSLENNIGLFPVQSALFNATNGLNPRRVIHKIGMILGKPTWEKHVFNRLSLVD